MGGRGANSGLQDGPTPGGTGNGLLYGQPNTPQMRPPAPTIRGQIGDKGKPQSPMDAMRRVNPDIKAIDAWAYADYQENCQRCVIAYELNRRGYNVEAESTMNKDPYPYGEHYLTAFKGAKSEGVGASTTAKVNKNIISKMSNWGEGSRGIVHISKGRAGHVFNVEYRGGKLYYYDAQHNERYDPARVFDHCTKSAVKVTRVDNLQISKNVQDLVRKSRTSR